MISFRTVSGRRVDMSQPQLYDINIEDIACALSRICRYTGHLRRFYSVAEHSLHVMRLVPPSLRLNALLHDGSEAYLGDISRNLKHSTYFQDYRCLEGRWQRTIEVACGVPEVSSADQRLIKAADDLMAIYERIVLRDEVDWVPEAHIPQLVSEGWVSSDPADMLKLAVWLPKQLAIYDLYVVEGIFLEEYARLAA